LQLFVLHRSLELRTYALSGRYSNPMS